MRRNQGFTLIELMVVMAIIAILATAGLSSYGGYIKKARDSTRISDLRAIETIIQATLTISGDAPDLSALISSITNMNNGKLIRDPMYDYTLNANREICLYDANTADLCGYYYAPCQNGGYILRAKFESISNIPKYLDDPLQTALPLLNSENDYDLGSCDDLINALDLTNGLID